MNGEQPNQKPCKCGHSKYVHIDCFHGACVKCTCRQYVPKVSIADEQNGNDVQRGNRSKH